MIEINSTFYGSQKPATFAKWRDDTPEDFAFSVKASRYATARRVLAESGDSVNKFIHSGIAELGEKLGPIVWQFADTKVFDPDDFTAFLNLLPKAVDGAALRHVLDVRHPSFMVPEYLALARQHHTATRLRRLRRLPCLRRRHGPVRVRPPDANPAHGEGGLRRRRRSTNGPTWPAPGRRAVHPAAPAAGGARAEGGAARDVFMLFIAGAKENSRWRRGPC